MTGRSCRLKMGYFVTFEGIEGSGKTTQINLAGGYLKKKGLAHILTKEPGGTPLADEIRGILLNRGSFEISSKAEVLLFAAARAAHVQEVILPALREKKIVLCDRFSDATLAYQSFGRGLDRETVQRISDFSSDSIKPDLTLLFDLPVEVGLERAMSRIARIEQSPAEDRFEREGFEFHERIRQGYLWLAKKESSRFTVLDSSKDVQTLHGEVCMILSRLIER
jgi:dTMP kinase